MLRRRQAVGSSQSVLATQSYSKGRAELLELF